MTVPVLHMHTAQSGLDALPKSAPTVETLDRVQSAFTGTTQPAEVAVKTTSTDSAEFKNAYLALAGKVKESPLLHGPVHLDVDSSHQVARIEIPTAGNGVDDASFNALAELRGSVLPATMGKLADTEWAVTGNTAASHDFNSEMKKSVPFVFGFVLLVAFLLLLASFRSIVIAVKAVLLNLLSVG